MIRAAALTVALGSTCAAADLLEESARWAPIADHGAEGMIDASDGYLYEGKASQWWAQALVTGQPRLRLDGLRIVQRDRADVPDGQLAGGYHYENIEGEFPSGPWYRGYLRAGTDALATKPGRALGAVGFAIAGTPLVGLDAEVGDSSERHLIANGDIHLPYLHVALAHDDLVDTARVGFEVRVPGSVNELAWDLALDGATTRWNGLPSGVTRKAAGFIGELTVAWSPWNHWLITGQAAVATNALREDGWQGTLATGALGLGLGW